MEFTSKRRSLLALALVPAVAGVLLAGCGGGKGNGRAPKRDASRSFSFSPGYGKLIDIGDERSLNLVCEGSGTPTVVVSAAVIDRSSMIRAPLERTTRTCAYDAAGNGYSPDPPRRPSDARSELQDVERLLRAAHLPPPYVLVGMTEGATVGALFAEAHPDQTAGLVLVEGVGPNWRSRFLALGRGQPARVQRNLRHEVGPSTYSGIDYGAVGVQMATVETLGDTPLAVVSDTKPPLDDPENVPPGVREAAVRLHTRHQDELAALSSNHVHVVATRSLELLMTNEPAIVVRAVRAVVEAARTGKPLPPCPRLFRGPGVRCRR